MQWDEQGRYTVQLDDRSSEESGRDQRRHQTIAVMRLVLSACIAEALLRCHNLQLPAPHDGPVALSRLLTICGSAPTLTTSPRPVLPLIQWQPEYWVATTVSAP